MTAITQNDLLKDNNAAKRISSIDFLRGLVMIIMALDHTRDFTHIAQWNFDPTDLTKTTPAIFFTRWITHYCAPTFVFLSGLSAYLSGAGKKTTKQLSLFLLTRGLWLIILEVTVVRFGILFNLFYDFSIFQVIWALGICMVFMSALVYLPIRWILSLGIIIILGHNILSQVTFSPSDSLYEIWALIHQPSPINWAPGKVLFVAYPFLSWLGIMMAGYAMGTLYVKSFNTKRRQSVLLKTGLAAVILFLILRAFNIYGDSSLWIPKKNLIFSIMSFLNTTKYPPSLLYTLMTLGPVLIILSLIERVNLNKLQPVIVYGRVPLFYYILHFYLIHITALTLSLITTGKSFSDLTFQFGQGNFGGVPSGTGFGLPGVYLIWISIVVALYPLCVVYNRYKSTHKYWWLSYL